MSAHLCPKHPEQKLLGGPAWFDCPLGHGVPAADLDHEYHPPVPAGSPS